MTNTKAFRQAVAQTVPHMDAEWDDSYGLVLESDGTHLFVVATDRYTIAVTRLPADSETPWKAMLGSQAVKTLQAALGMAGSDIAFEHSPEKKSLRLTSGDTSIGVTTMRPTGRPGNADEDGFFDWRLVIRRLVQAPPVEMSVQMTLKFLARWQHLGERATFWATGERRPVMVVAEDFIGGQMPISHSDKGNGVEGWRKELADSWVPIVGKHAEYAGVDYDLSRTYLDQDGDPWEYVRHESVTGEPLMNVPGLDGGELTLAGLVETYGPLRAGAKI